MFVPKCYVIVSQHLCTLQNKLGLDKPIASVILTVKISWPKDKTSSKGNCLLNDSTVHWCNVIIHAPSVFFYISGPSIQRWRWQDSRLHHRFLAMSPHQEYRRRDYWCSAGHQQENGCRPCLFSQRRWKGKLIQIINIVSWNLLVTTFSRRILCQSQAVPKTTTSA